MSSVSCSVSCLWSWRHHFDTGYAGDVWNPQPPEEDHPWRTMPNHGMTPHYSGTTLDAQVLLFSLTPVLHAIGTIADCSYHDDWWLHGPLCKQFLHQNLSCKCAFLTQQVKSTGMNWFAAAGNSYTMVDVHWLLAYMMGIFGQLRSDCLLQARYADGTKKMLQNWFDEKDFPKEWYIVREGELADQYKWFKTVVQDCHCKPWGLNELHWLLSLLMIENQSLLSHRSLAANFDIFSTHNC